MAYKRIKFLKRSVRNVMVRFTSKEASDCEPSEMGRLLSKDLLNFSRKALARFDSSSSKNSPRNWARGMRNRFSIKSSPSGFRYHIGDMSQVCNSNSGNSLMISEAAEDKNKNS